MARVLVIPDSHLKVDVIKNGMELAERTRCEKVVLMGDYFDDWVAPISRYHEMYQYLKELIKDTKVTPLIGNHELGYLQPGFQCSGNREEAGYLVRDLILDDHRFKTCFTEDGVLYTHAGVTRKWIEAHGLIQPNVTDYHMGKANGAELVGDAMDTIETWKWFNEAGAARGGSDIPSPMWADLTELLDDRYGAFPQVVGHSPVSQIEMLNNVYFTDTYSNGNPSDEYLIVDDGEPVIVNYKEIVKENAPWTHIPNITDLPTGTLL